FAARLRASARGIFIEDEATEQRSRRALLVDDSATVLEFHRLLLEDDGYQVETCLDGQQALGRAIHEAFDLVVAGLQNETLGGFALCTALHADASRKDTVVVLTSADNNPRLADRAKE